MTKSDLVRSFAVEMRLRENRARAIIDTIIDSMTDALARGEGIELRGFGSFAIRHYKAFEGRNPKSGEPVKVKSKRLPFFKASQDLKDKLTGKTTNSLRGERGKTISSTD